GVDGYGFWTRYLDVFDRVLVAARTRMISQAPALPPVDGSGVEVAALPDYRGPWEYLRARPALVAAMRHAVASADALCLRAPAWPDGRSRVAPARRSAVRGRGGRGSARHAGAWRGADCGAAVRPCRAGAGAAGDVS